MSHTQLDLGTISNIDVIDQFLDVKNQFVVDAGCGAMGLSRALAKRGASVLAIDPDPVQAQINEQADVVANVGFARSGAEAIPVESGSVDGVFFSYSLHHVPSELFPAVFAEIARVLKPDGFIYVMEPVAAGELNEVMQMFHDERAVRKAAQRALDTLAIPQFAQIKEMTYEIPISYDSWEDFESQYVSSSYNTQSYTAEDVQNDAVKSRFLKLAEAKDYQFKSPVKVTYLRGYKGNIVGV